MTKNIGMTTMSNPTTETRCICPLPGTSNSSVDPFCPVHVPPEKTVLRQLSASEERSFTETFRRSPRRVDEKATDDYAPVTELTDYPRNNREQP